MAAIAKTIPVPVSAFTCVSASGMGNHALYQDLLNNNTALTDLTLIDVAFQTHAGEILEPLPEIHPDLGLYNSRNSRLALAALDYSGDGFRSAIDDAISRYGSHRVGVVVGTSTSGLYETEKAYERLLEEGRMPDDFHFLTRHAFQATPRFLQLEIGASGPCYAISTACSSGAKAIGAGQRLINNGICDAVLVGGVDTLCRLTLRGFHSLDLITEDYCRPMDRQRKGINIGEAAGLLLLEKPRRQLQDKAHVLAVGESSDAHHMSTPHPEGMGAALAMQRALQMSASPSSSIDYINLHATATPINDQIEAIAINNVFGENVPCSGTKGVTGHTLGAAGALEGIIALLALEHQFIPGTWGLVDLDEDCRCQVVKESLTEQRLHKVLSNSFGFGGNNACMIFSAHHE